MLIFEHLYSEVELTFAHGLLADDRSVPVNRYFQPNGNAADWGEFASAALQRTHSC